MAILNATGGIETIDIVNHSDISMIREWNNTPTRTVSACLHDLFAKEVTLRPEASAIASPQGNFTYHELNSVTDQLAWHLLSLGVKIGSFVPVCFDKSAWAIVSMLSILKAGGVCVALDPKQPVTRLQSILHDVEAQHILVDLKHASIFKGFVSDVVAIDSAFISTLPSTQSDLPKTKPTDAAFVVFTSGSTGKPKGIVLEHQSLCTSAEAHGNATSIGPSSRVLQFAAYTFDVSIQDMFTSLSRGGCVCVISDEERMNDLAGAINRLEANWACLTATVARLLDPAKVPLLRTLVLGGEPASTDVVRKWADQVNLFNVYGPAESSIWTSCSQYLNTDSDPMNIGTALANRLWVAKSDNHNLLAPIGCVGELLLEGPLLARGYFKDEQKTIAAFVHVPDWLEGSEKTHRMYKTGDLVRYNTDGTLSYVSRKDTQVKFNGLRIELGDIEHHITILHAEAPLVAVDVITAANSQTNLIAAFLQSRCRSDEADPRSSILPMSRERHSHLSTLRAALFQRLPTYMVPSLYIPLKSMPTTVSGKLDRKELRRIASELRDTELQLYALSDASKKAPATEMESTLQEIWSQVLSQEKPSIGTNDSFFQLGGDSVTAMKMILTAQERGIPLEIAAVFRHPELSQLAAQLAVSGSLETANVERFSLLRSGDEIEEILQQASIGCQIQPEQIEDIYPCTPLQEGMIAVSAHDPLAYVSQMTYRIPEDLDVDCFRLAWDKIIEAHPILRTRIVYSAGGSFYQVVTSDKPVWQTAPSLWPYVAADRDSPIKAGEPLVRFCIAQSSESAPDEKFFVWTAHHAAYDGYSIGIILDNVSKAYHEGILPKPLPFNRLINLLENRNRDDTERYWLQQFEDGAPISYPQMKEYGADTRSGESLKHRIAMPARLPSNLTTSSILRAAWAVIVGRYSDADDVVFGATLSGRNANVNGIMNMVGPTICTLPVRVKIDPSLSAREFLQSVQDQAVAMIPFEHTGLQDIRQMLGKRSEACSVNNLLVIQPATETDKANKFLGLKKLQTDSHDFLNYPLAVLCDTGSEEISFEAYFDASILPRHQVSMMLRRFAMVFSQLCDNTDGPLPEVADMLDDFDVEQVLQWNSAVPKTVNERLHDGFNRQVAKRPDALAICSAEGEFSYRTLNTLSDKLAHYLVSQNIGPEVFVALCFEKSAWAIVSMLAVLKAGGVFFSLDPSHPQGRSLDMIQDAHAEKILTSAACLSLFEGHIATAVAVDRDFLNTLPQANALPLTSSAAPTNTAILIFTSGSTGKPKAVVLEHRNLASSVKYIGEAMGVDDRSRVFQFSSYTFDVSLFDIFTTITCGGCVCIPTEAQRMGNLAAAMRQLDVNVSFLTPTVARTIRPDTVPQLHTLVLGGEAVGDADIDLWADSVRLISGYGPSECTIFCATDFIRHGKHGPGYIGKAVGCTSWVVEPSNPQKLAPVGLVGELLIQGPNVAQGYLNNSDQTAKSFITKPAWLPSYLSEEYRRLYCTGDLVRYNPDGSMDYLGRKDTQVKIRGQRIELSEIEHQVRPALVNVRSFAVATIERPGMPQTKTLALYLCPDSQKEAQTDKNAEGVLLPLSDDLHSQMVVLRSTLADKLPSHMIPTMYVALRALPMTASSKLDRQRLQRVVDNLSQAQVAHYSLVDASKRAPSTPREALLRQVWSNVLSVAEECIGVSDSFFRVGGDSISAMRLATAMEAWGYTLSVSDIFRKAQLQHMATVMVQVGAGREQIEPFDLLSDAIPKCDLLREASAQCGCEEANIEDIYPCTPLQEGLLAVSARQKRAYSSQMQFKIPRGLHVDRFRAAWNAVINAHPILRTRITSTRSAGIVQVVVSVSISWQSDHSVENYLQKDQRKPFDYGSPLHRLAIVKESATGDQKFVWTAHHAVYDGHSIDLIFDQVKKYFQQSAAPSPSLFNPFIKYLQNIDTDMSKRFWREYFGEGNSITYPAPSRTRDRSRPNKIHQHSFKISTQQNSSVTVATVLRAAWGIVLARYSNSNSVVFGVTLSGRSSPVANMAQLVGPTMTTVPVRIVVDKDTSKGDFLRGVQKQAIEMIPFEHTGLQSIRKYIADINQSLDLESLLVLQPTGGADQDFLGLEAIPAQDHHFQDFPLVTSCTMDNDHVQVVATFDDSVIPAEQMARMLQHFEHIIHQMTEEPELPLDSIELFSEHDRAQVYEWNGHVPATTNACVHDLLQQWVGAKPSAQAVVSDEAVFTWQELDTFTTHLARYLSESGVGPEVIVALCFDKSPWAIVAMIGVLKAGGAFFSLNPSHPSSRSLGMIQEVGAHMLLASPQHVEFFSRDISSVAVDGSFFRRLQSSKTSSLSSTVSPENAAILIFTSGSTGKPKGVVLEHRSLCTSIAHHGPPSAFSSSTRSLQFSSYTFDASIFEIFTTLCHGGCVCSPSESQRMGSIAAFIEKHKVNLSFMTPTVARTIQPESVPSLRALILGGEPLRDQDIRSWADRLTLVAGYGPSECTICCACDQVTGLNRTPNYIGRPVGCHAWIVEEENHDRLTPVGLVGELVIQGITVARGYLNHPENTAASFILAPQWFPKGRKVVPTRFYKTGDLVRYNPDGTMVHIGRKDKQVKIRGQRVELGEIELALKILAPRFNTAVDLVRRPGGKQQEILAAFMSTPTDETVDLAVEEGNLVPLSPGLQDELRGVQVSLAEQLPRYMVPSIYLTCKSMPLLPSGKLDRPTLGAMVLSLSEADIMQYSLANVVKRSPSTAKEKKLQLTWAELLEVTSASIGADDSLLQLGGDSVIAMRLSSVLREHGWALTVADIFRYPRLCDMASAMQPEQDEISATEPLEAFRLLSNGGAVEDMVKEAASKCRVRPELIEDIYPCTPLQENLLHVSTHQRGAYVSRMKFKMPSNIDLHKFTVVWEKLVDMHDILRTRIVQLKGCANPMQVVVQEEVNWNYAESLATYLDADKALPFTYNSPLFRLGISGNHPENQHFIITAHHAVYDGYSLGILFDQATKLMNKVPIPRTQSFSSFIEYLSDKNFDASASNVFWRSQFGGSALSTYPSLPSATFKPRPNHTERVSVKFSSTPHPDILPSSVLRAAWALLIGRYLDSADVVFGTVLSGRNAPIGGINHMIGPTLATVPLPVHVDREQSVTQFLQAIQSQAIDMIPFEQTRLSDIHRLGGNAQDAVGFKNLLVVQPASEAGPDIDGLGLEGLPNDLAGFETYALVVECILEKDCIEIEARHDLEVLSAQQVRNMLGQLDHVIQQLRCGSGYTKIADIDFFGARDKAQLLEWNKVAPQPIDSCVHTGIQEQCLKQPGRPAVCAWDGDLTYGQLDNATETLAQHLQTLGVGPEENVALCFDKSMWAIVAILAVLKAGGSFTHLSPEHPTHRDRLILTDSNAKLVLVSPQYAARFDGVVPSVLAVSQEQLQKLPEPSERVQTAVHPSNAACVTYTSGSTGIPKGIVLEHSAIVSNIYANGAAQRVGPETRALQYAAFAFDVHMQDILTTLYRGGCVCAISEYQRMNDLVGGINATKANSLALTSTVASLLTPQQLPSVKTLVLAGEKASPNVIDTWGAYVTVLDAYGPAECTISSAISKPLKTGKEAGNIGVGSGTRIWLVEPSDHDKLVPVGCVGEALIEGPQLARGYLNNDEMTEKSFIRNPDWVSSCGLGSNIRLYKTGDLLRQFTDGSHEYIGRKDSQVKLRGQRIELGEIEFQINSLLSDHQTAGVVIAAVGGVSKQHALVAFLKLKEDSASSDHDTELFLPVISEHKERLTDIKSQLYALLPPFMVPSLFIPLRKMPLNLSGKLERSRLQQIANSLSDADTAEYSLIGTNNRAPSTQMEKDLCAVWSELFGVAQKSIGAEDNFLRLGGDSIMAMRLVTASRTHGWNLTVADIFQRPQLSSLARHLTAIQGQEMVQESFAQFSLLSGVADLNPLLRDVGNQCGISSDLINDIYPCTPLQEGLMAITAKSHGAYLSQMAFRIPNHFPIKDFQDAWSKVIQAHTILRTRIVNVAGHGSLQVVTSAPVTWQYGESLASYLDMDKNTPITHSTLLFRLGLTKSSSEGTHFIWSAHHSIYDGYSLGLMFNQVSRCLNERVPPQTSKFNGFVGYLQQSSDQDAERYWHSQFDGGNSTTFPTGRMESPPRLNSTHRKTMKMANKHASTITRPTILRAAWALLMARYSESDDVVFAATLSGRNAPVDSIMDIVGPTIATVPVRVRIHREQSVGYYLHSIQDQATEMMPFEHFGLQNIRRLGSNAALAAEVQNLLVIQPAEEQDLDPTFLGMESIPIQLDDTQMHALVMQCNVGAQTIHFDVQYDSSRFHSSAIERIVDQFEHVIRQLSLRPEEAPLQKVSIFSPQDERQILEWNKEPVEYVDACLHEVISQQAKLTPNAQAITSFDRNFNYQELDYYSSLLAQHLSKLGVKSGAMVALCLEKSALTIVTMVAVLKAGGAYFSLDASHPPARSLKMIADTEANLLLMDMAHENFLRGNGLNVTTLSLPMLETLPSEISSPTHKNTDSSNNAILIFTSGSTGTPKAVVLQHGALTNSIKHHGSACGFDESTRAFQFSSYTFDASIFDIFTTLCHGGCICVPSEKQRMGDLSCVMRELEVNFSFMTPTLARTLGPDNIPNLKTLVLGGEPIGDVDIDRWTDKLILISGYGPSECSMCCACGAFGKNGGSCRPGYIGRAVGSRAWIAEPEDHHQLTPVGLIGELLVDGPILARGYLNDPQRTASAFISAPAWLPNSSEYDRLYKTGDLVRYNTDGTMDYVGRKDKQVKIRGQRIELCEIEYHAKASFQDIQALAAIQVTHPNNSSFRAALALFVCLPETLPATARIDADDLALHPSRSSQERLAVLQTALGEVLPSYMIPSLYIPVRRLPTSTAGKLDVLFLQKLVAQMSEDELRQYSLSNLTKRAPNTETELELQSLWAQAIKISQASIGADDHFFRVGGDSISAMQLVVALQNRGLGFSVADVFRQPKLADMARALADVKITGLGVEEIEPFQLVRDVESSNEIVLEAAAQCQVDLQMIEDIYPCTPLQEGLMAVSAQQVGAYLSQLVFKIPPELDASRFKESWARLIDMHPILRTRIVNLASGRSFQAVCKDAISWSYGVSLADYLDKDKQIPVSLGSRLIRLAFVKGPNVRYFVLTIHHTIYDGVTMALIFQQLSRLYDHGISPVPSHFNQFINYLEQVDPKESNTFWQRQFEGGNPARFPEVSSAHVHPRPDQRLTQKISLPRKSNSGVTMPTILRAAWALLMARHCDSDDVVFAASLSGRNAAVRGISDLLGPTLTTVPVRVRINRAQTIHDFLHQIQDQATETIPFEHTGLQNIRVLGGAAALAGDLRSLLLIQPAEEVGKDISFLGLENVPNDLEGFQSSALTLELTLGQTDLVIDAQFDSALISVTQAQWLLDQFDHVVKQLCGREETTPLESINYASESDREQIDIWNRKEPEALEACVHEMIEEQVAARGNAPAICSFDGNWTYEQLNDASDKLASHLQSLGVGAETMVPFCFDKSAYAIISMLAILKAGGVCVALNPKYPQVRLRAILQSVSAMVVLASQSYDHLFQNLVPSVIEVSEDMLNKLSQPPSQRPGLRVTPSSPSFVVFTSGSTGLPKGIVLEHRSIATSGKAHGSATSITQDSRVLQFAAYTFDVSIQDVFTTLMRGGCVCVISEDERLGDLENAINRVNANWACLTSTVARLISPSRVPSLRTLVLGGEPATADVYQKWANHVKLMNVYGPAESSIWTSCNPTVRVDTSPVNIGKALASHLWIADASDHNKLAPLGCIGELLLQGPLLARGYLNDGQKTNAVFVPAPHWVGKQKSSKVERMYKTGDLVRYNDDGSINYVARKDTQVKLRGQRLELGEVEHHITRNLSGLSQLAVEVVHLRTSAQPVEVLAAFLHFEFESKKDSLDSIMLPLSDDDQVKMVALQSALSSILPGYMVPSIFISLRIMPTTTSGKLDRKELRHLAATLSGDQAHRYSLADVSKKQVMTSMEKTLQNLWAEILQRPPSSIGANDNFFRLGGDSVTAMRMVAQATRQELSVSVGQIFQHPQLSALARVVEISAIDSPETQAIEPFTLLDSEDRARLKLEAVEQCDVPMAAIEDIYPCTALQEGLMSISLHQEGAYISQMVFRIPKSFSVEKFKQSWDKVFEANPILRTRIIYSSSNQTFQVIIRETVEWQTGKYLQEYLKAHGSLLIGHGGRTNRLGLVDGPEGRYFIWTAHHATYDGYTIGLLFHQVSSYYEKGEEPESSHFNRFVKYLGQADAEAAKSFWRQELEGGQPVTFPQRRSASDQGVRSDHIKRYSMELPGRDGMQFTVSTVLRAAWAIVLGRYAESDDIVFGTTLSGRNATVHGMHQLLGPTIATVPLRIRLNLCSIGDLLQAIQAQGTAMIPYEQTGLQNIALLGGNAREAADITNLLVVQPAEAEGAATILGLEQLPMELQDFQPYPLVMSCTLHSDSIDFEARFSGDLLPAKLIQRMLRHLEHVVKQLMTEPSTSDLGSIDLFNEYDRKQISIWNGKDHEIADKCIHDVFKTQVDTNPDAPAIESFDGYFTYGQLDAASTQLARYLTQIGVGPGTVIPLCFNKSAWTIVAMLAVVKAGAAYCSLNSDQPLARSLEMIRHVSANTLLVGPEFEAMYRGHLSEVITVDTALLDRLALVSELANVSLAKVAPGEPGILVFTSGSTGKPKAVVLEHRSICTMTQAQTQTMRFRRSNRVLQFAAYAFDVSNGEIHTTLMMGGCICVPSQDERMDDLAGAISRLQANWLFLTPTVASLLSPQDVPSLKTLVLGGEAPTKALVHKWASAVDLVLSYGPAECSINFTSAPSVNTDTSPQTIGKPHGGSAWICDLTNYDRLAPVGCVGELLIEGPIVARGYFNDSEKTKAAFTSNPSWLPNKSRDLHRIYRTGDLVKYNTDGSISFVGRRDTQIKLNGQRIDLGEIEHHVKLGLPNLPYIAVEAFSSSRGQRSKALALFMSREQNDKEAISSLPLSGNSQREMMSLKQLLQSFLPPYMVPALYITVNTMPSTSSGKIDRASLRNLASELSEEQIYQYSLSKASKRAPESQMEQTLQRLWADVLVISASAIGADDSFFAAGGDSMAAMKLVVQARAAGVSLSVASIFKYPKLTDLALATNDSKPVSKEVPEYQPFSLFRHHNEDDDLDSIIAANPGLDRSNIMDVLPTSDFQALALTGALTKSRWMLNSFCLRGSCVLNVDRFERACRQVVQSEAILRTAFILHRGTYLQVVLKSFKDAFKVHETDQDLHQYSKSLQAAGEFTEISPGEPISRIILIKRKNTTEFCIIVRLSHAQYDGVSLPFIWHNLSAAYNSTPAITTQPHSAYMADMLSRIPSSRKYWRRTLAGASMTALGPVQSQPSLVASTERTNTVGTLVGRFEESIKHISPSTVIRSAWAYALAQLSSTSDVVFGHVVAGRNSDTMPSEKISGPCMNIVPMRVQINDSWTATELCNVVQDHYASSIPFEGLGFREIIKDCTNWPSWTRFSSVLQQQRTSGPLHMKLGESELTMDVEAAEDPTADVTIFTQPKGDSIEITLSAASDVFSVSQARTILDLLSTTIACWAETPDISLKDSPKLQKNLDSKSGGLHHAHINKFADLHSQFARTSRYANTEKTLTRAWSSVFGKDLKIDTKTTLWDVGGDLISAGQLTAHLRREGLEVTVEELAERPKLMEQLLFLCSTV
jgi:amino acid adenylation domain-containing protein